MRPIQGFLGLQFCALEDRVTPALTRGLDFTFNGNGQLELAFDISGAKADLGTALAVQSDGKIVVVGSAQIGTSDVDFAIIRLNPDGSLDKTFADGGRRLVGFDLGGNRVDQATSVAIQPDGTILVAGFAEVTTTGDFDFAVVRLTSTGDLDLTFDKDGRQTVAFDVNGSTLSDKAAGIALDSQGRILLAGTVAGAGGNTSDFGVVRLLGNGALDVNFGTGGRQLVGFDLGGNLADMATGLVVDSKDRPVIVGSVQTGAAGDLDFGIARLTTVGALDTSFNGTGRVTIGFNGGGSNADSAAAVALDPTGRILVTGSVAVGNGNLDIGIVRLASNGAADSSFGTNGRRIYGFDLGGSNRDVPSGIAVDPSSGRISIAATVDQPTAGNTNLGLLALTTNGELDRSFSPDGRAQVAFDRGGALADTAGGMALDTAGRMVVVATIDSATGNNRNIGVVRLVANTNLSQLLVAGGPLAGNGRTYRTNGQEFVFTSDFVGPSNSATTRTAVGDLNGDGIPDQILGAGAGGGSRIRILLGVDPAIQNPSAPAPIEFDAFEGGFTGGVFVAAADVDGDGRAEFTVSPDVGGGPRASVYSLDGANSPFKRADFFGIDDPNFRGGARVAMGDINGDGRADLVVGAGFLGGPRIAIFNGATLFAPDSNGVPPKLVGDFFAFPGSDAQTLRNGVFVAVGDLNGDGLADLIFGGGPGGGPRVYALNGQFILAQQYDTAYDQPLANFFVGGDDASRGGVRLAVKDLDGDAKADLITASGDQLPSQIRVYRGATFVQPNGVEPPVSQSLDPFGDELFNGVFVG